MNSLLEDIRADMKTKQPEEKKFEPHGITGQQLDALDIPPMKWAVEGILPEGACLLAGSPKIGKSWLALNLALAVANGGVALGRIKVEQGNVLYLALEDGTRRLQSRQRKLMASLGISPPERIVFFTRWPKCGEGGLGAIKEAMTKHKPRLVIVDTLARIQDSPKGNDNKYLVDYQLVGSLQELGLEMGIAIVLITHVRKSGAGKVRAADPLEEVSGTMGLTGAADVVLVLSKTREEKSGTLFVTGRDVIEQEFRMLWDGQYCQWSIAEGGDVHDPDAGCTAEQRKILAALRQALRPISPAEIAKVIGKEVNATQQALKRMHEVGLIERPCYGRYTHTPHSKSDHHSDTRSYSDSTFTETENHPTPFG
jgi:hypothetical protein